MMHFCALKLFVKSPERMSRARWSAHTCPTTRAETRGGDEDKMEVLAGRLCPAVRGTSLGGCVPIRALPTTTQVVPASRPAGRSVMNGEPPAELETYDSPLHYHTGTVTIDARSQADGRLAQKAAEFSDARTHRGCTRHLQGGFGVSSLTIPGVWDEKTLVLACGIRDCHPITIGNGESATSIGLVYRV